ncbi:MAG: NADH-quinone oxidoreductase subunit NuoK [Leptospira sp.]|jgi:NADH-quinone oxidoreductase subunit K|nr:NADH-quinone oxidoreductase subunit NuoK [Leptospira sp.]
MNSLVSGIPVSFFLGLAGVLFSIGVLGVLMRRNAVVIFMSVELILNSVNLVFVTFSKSLSNISGETIVFFVMAIAAAEAAVGLALVIAIFRHKKSTNVDELQSLKW